MSSPQASDFQKAEVTQISITVDAADIIRRSGCAMCVLEDAHGSIAAYPARVMDGILYALQSPTYSFDLEGRLLTVFPEQGPKMLAWRTWHSAWHVLDPRVSASLNKVDDIVEGEEPRAVSRPAVLGAPYGKDAEPMRGDAYERAAKLIYGEEK